MEETKSRVDGLVTEAVDEGKEKQGEGVFRVGEEELFGKAETGGSNGGGGGGNCVFKRLRRKVHGVLVTWWDFGAEGREEVVAKLGLGEDFRDEDGGMVENLG